MCFNDQECSIIEQQLDKALERPYGPEFNLELAIHAIGDKSQDELLLKYKDIITFLQISFYPNNPRYLQPSCEFRNLNELVIKTVGHIGWDEIFMVEEMLSKYGDKLEHFGLHSFKSSSECGLRVPNLSNLKSLEFYNVDRNTFFDLLNMVSKQNISRLHLSRVDNFAGVDVGDFAMPNIKSIKLELESLLSWVIIKLNKDTLVEIDITRNISLSFGEDLPIGEVEQIHLPNLKILRINGFDETASISLIKGSAQTLVKLHLYDIELNDNDFNEISFPNLKYLSIDCKTVIEFIRRTQDTLVELEVGWFNDISNITEANPIKFYKLKTLSIAKREDALYFIRSASDTITRLNINGCHKTNQRYLKDLEVTNLKTIVFHSNTSNTAMLAFIRLGVNTITKLIIGNKVITTEKLDKLKHILKIVKNVNAGELDSILNS